MARTAMVWCPQVEKTQLSDWNSALQASFCNISQDIMVSGRSNDIMLT